MAYYGNLTEQELGFDAFIAPDDFDRTAQPVDIYEVFKREYALNGQARYIYYYSDGNYPLTLTPTTDEYYRYGYRNGGVDVIYDVPLSSEGGVATTIWGASGNTSGGDESGFTHRWVVVYRVSTEKFDVFTTKFRRCLWIYCGGYVDLVKLSEVDIYNSTEYDLKWIHYANVNSIRGQFGSGNAYHNSYYKMQGRAIIPETLNSIGAYMFAAQHNINKYNFPLTKNVSIIWAPQGSRSLPYGVTEVGFGASTTVDILSDVGSTYANSYSRIKQLSVSDQNVMYSSHSGCDIIYSKNGDNIICVAAETVRGVYLPDNLPQSELDAIGVKITGIYTNLSANIMQNHQLYIGTQITDLTNLYLGNKSFVTIEVGAENEAFVAENNILFNTTKTQLIKAGTYNTGNLIIPNGVTEILANSFLRCNGYTGNLSIPSSVTSIASSSLNGLTQLTSLTLPLNYNTAIYSYFGFANFSAESLNASILNLMDGAVGSPKSFFISKTSLDALNAAYPNAVSDAALRFINVSSKPTVASYNFNGNLFDTSDLNSELNLSLVGGATIANDVLNVTGSGRYAQALDPTGKASFGSGAMTIACKVRVNSFAANMWIANKRDSSTIINNAKAEWQFYFDAGKPRLALIDSSKTSNTSIGAVSNQTLLTNTTYHIAVTFSGGVGDFFKIYVNGIQVAHTFTQSGVYESMRNNGSALRLGNSGWDSGTIPLNGWMDNFKLYASELTAQEIQVLSNE